jgi:hypothetical protein
MQEPSMQMFLWWNALAIGFIWVPFAVAAFLVERGGTWLARWRERLGDALHPGGGHQRAHAH